LHNHFDAPQAQAKGQILKRVIQIFALAFLLAGCTHLGHRAENLFGARDKSEAKIAEESRALTTGIVDTLSVAPTNAPVILALDLARADQQLEGLPEKRIDVAAILAGDAQEITALRNRIAGQENLLKQKALLENKLRETEAALVEKGKLYEAEKNKHIVRRVWEWGLSTFGIGGLIALCFFCPALIPVLGSFVGWIVGKIPALVSVVGMVPKKAFDAVIKGVGQYREIKKQTEKKPVIDSILGPNTEPHAALIESRRAKLEV
jgi:hypothetical protein